ncbi:glutathione-regulated potassium-efflux transport system protein KefC [Octadecabacter antarcticus 307]|uniref:Glutathione-regulated potassium-efflux transport system protein KefC n=1 Tax=Octadecabacter antarcticus 307 TaxID=391626 RepID=M9RAC2_9RHOB|nr:cation:proton antiporter [Octadecabacter antarcticus]AGI67311.1 glutathione-regulated potassium-efflux transport system protein KefC [Octadecabacter antarcticus 307]
MEQTLLLATILLGAAVIAVPLAARLGLGSVLGYLLAGVAIAPLIGAEAAELQHVAEFGVVMMLFLIGLELEPRALWGMRHRLIGLGGLQIGLTTLLITALFMGMGQPWQTALAIGMIFALSSTAIVLQTLSEKGLMQTSGGRNTFSVLLTQDIAVIPMLAILPLLALRAPVRVQLDGSMARGPIEEPTDHSMSLVDGLPGWGVTLVTIGAVVAVILIGVFLTKPIFRYIHQARLREMYTALALLIVVSIATLMGLVGLSAALGTFLAGVVLANSEFRHELESDLAPFKGLLLGLFFITVGAGIDFGVLFAKPARIIGLTLAVMVIKGCVLYFLARVFNIKGRARWLFTLGLAQAGEFGFVLIAFSLQQNVLGPILGADLLLVVALSMMITPLLFIVYDVVSRRIKVEDAEHPEDEIDEKGTVIIAGIGRFGQVVNRLVQSSGFSTVVLDNNLKTVQLMRTFGFKGFFGDPTRPDILHAAGLDDASVLVVALDNKDAAVTLVKYARGHRPDLHIIARARDSVHVYELYAAGANDIVRELFDSSLRAGRYVLENLGLSEYEASEAEMSYYHHDRATLRDLAKVWDPNVPIAKNKAYIERAKAADRDLESALTETLDEAEREATRRGDTLKPKTAVKP